MAYLEPPSEHEIGVEFVPLGTTDGCNDPGPPGVDFSVRFVWHGESLIRSELIKTWGWRGQAAAGAFSVHDCDAFGLVRAVRRFIQTGEPFEYQTLDPDLTVSAICVAHNPEVCVVTTGISCYGLRDAVSYGNEIQISTTTLRSGLATFADTLEQEISAASHRLIDARERVSRSAQGDGSGGAP